MLEKKRYPSQVKEFQLKGHNVLSMTSGSIICFSIVWSSVADPGHFGADPDPRIQIRGSMLWLMDQDAAFFVIDLTDAKKKQIKTIGFLRNIFLRYVYNIF